MGEYHRFLFIYFIYFLQYKVPSHGIKQPAQKAQEKVVGVNKTQRFIKKKNSLLKSGRKMSKWREPGFQNDSKELKCFFLFISVFAIPVIWNAIV